MQYSFYYIKGKVLQGLRTHFVSRPEVKVLAYAVNIFALISVILYWLKKIRPQAFLLCSFLWIMLLIIFWFVMPNVIYKKAIQIFQDKFIANFNEEGIILENDRGSITWEWQRFTNYFESPNFFHLYFNARSFFLFPKDEMSDDFKQALKVLLSQKLRKGKY